MQKKIKVEELSFEDALQELEEISNKLELGKDSLEDSIKLYERGVFLRDLCQKKLKEAEGKWKVLHKQKNGEVVAQEIDNSSIPQPNDLNYIQDTMF